MRGLEAHYKYPSYRNRHRCSTCRQRATTERKLRGSPKSRTRAEPLPRAWPCPRPGLGGHEPPVRRRLGNAVWPGHDANLPDCLQIPARRGAELHPSLAPACFLLARGGGNINGSILGKVWMLPLDRLRWGAEAALAVSLGFSL